jgi:hypothetical protein
LHNTSGAAVDLSGWNVRDKNDADQSYTFAAHSSLDAGARIQIYTEPGHPYSFNSKSPIWNNCGDAAELRTPGGQVVATYAYVTHLAP